MVNLKTKFDKHAQDNEKRRKSIKEKEKARLSQSQIIKEALSNSSLNNSSSKKIVFDDESDDGGGDVGKEQIKKVNGKDKTVLFESSGSEDESFEIKEKTQFDGKKGFELLNLQSTYGNDERFKIDERFLDEEKDEDGVYEEEKEKNGSADDGEKAMQLKILESVLGEPISTPDVEKKAKSRTFEMVRYDATNKDHEKYELKPQTPASLKKKKERKKLLEAVKEGSPKPQVSKEKFYEVSSEIKTAFKEKKEDGQFSLLQTYGVDDVGRGGEAEEEEEEEEEEEVEEEGEEKMEEDVYESLPIEEDELPRKEKKKEEEVVEKRKNNEKGVVAQGIWKESFFFSDDDPRFKEGLEFMNKKNSEEAEEAAENYDKTRRNLREILRLHMKKQLHKKDPFRNKVGGMNKKQLANSRYKNFKSSFNKKKPPKVNRAGKI